MISGHIPVLKTHILSHLPQSIRPSFYVLDLTFGAGGHALSLLNFYKALSLSPIIIGIDQDAETIKKISASEEGKLFLKDHFLLKGNFADLPILLKQLPINHQEAILQEGFLVILADIGVSSFQIDEKQRGFSFLQDGPLDMRMNQDQSLDAFHIINFFKEKELEIIISSYGEEKFARQIAQNICKARHDGPINTTAQLENIIYHTYPPKLRHGRLHPATKTFQAIRIEVNQELEVLKKATNNFPNFLSVGGRFFIISFHSLEDRIVKHSFKNLSLQNSAYRIISKKPIIADDKEIQENPRSRSAKLRILEKKFS